VHRDLKPANIKLRPDGTVKVLDFGIAKAIETQAFSGPQGPSLTTPAMTQAGILFGTAAYMAPEQARGKQVDQRADIWAFGCVLYEMLTGQPAFGGEDVPMTLARVLANDTDLKTMPAAVSPAVRHTIKLCLEKDVSKRIADIRDVKLALAGTFETGLPLAGDTRSARRRSLVALWLPLAAAALAILALVAWLSAPPRVPAALPELRLAANLPANITDASDFGPRPGDFALSPDGRYVVLNTSRAATGTAANGQLWLWRLDSGEARPLAGADRAQRPFWSPDGRSVLFSTEDGALKKADIVGGSAQTVVPTGVGGTNGGGSSRGDVVVFGDSTGGFSIVTSTGGTKSVTEITEAAEHHELPALLPDGKRFLYFRHTFQPETQGIYLASVDNEPAEQPSAPVVLADDGPVLVEDADTGSRYLLFMRERSLLAQGFDVDGGAVHGEPVVVASNVEGGGGQGWYSASADGRLLVFREGAYEDIGEALKSLVWVDRGGAETALPTPPRAYNHASLSPDGRHIALLADRAVWIWDVERESLTRLSSTHESLQGAVWTPDSRRVAFRDRSNEVLWQPADGASDAEARSFERRGSCS
jgi:WD40 repeat protein